jgi:hypothetical protein
VSDASDEQNRFHKSVKLDVVDALKRAEAVLDLQQWMQCYAFDVIGNVTVSPHHAKSPTLTKTWVSRGCVHTQLISMATTICR